MTLPDWVLMKINPGSSSPASTRKHAGRPLWISRELAGADRTILSFAIFLDQFLLSIYCLWIVAVSPNTGNLSFIIGIFGLWGLISACSLFFTRYLPRVVALLWHLIFVCYVLGRSDNLGLAHLANDPIGRWALYDCWVVVYLAVTAVIQYRNSKRTSEMSLLNRA